MDVFGDLTPAPADADVTLTARRSTARAQQLDATFDKRYGGFGDAPKFPHPGSIDRLHAPLACHRGRRSSRICTRCTWPRSR